MIEFNWNSGQENVVRLLIESGASVNILNKGKKSALHMAAFNGNSQICEMQINIVE